MSIDLTPTIPASSGAGRMFACIWNQKKNNHVCPQSPRLDGKKILVTGGAAGIGEFVSRGLIARGAKVTSMARGLSDATDDIMQADSIYLDLADPKSIVAAVDKLAEERFDMVICNAGLVSKKAEQTIIGVEKTFAVNVLGHHILYRLLIERDLLNPNARIVMTTGDVYILEKECSPNIPFDKTQKTYSRSKLGNLWQVAELTKRYPTLHPIAVHPGVVASGFAGAKSGFMAWLRSLQLVSEIGGAQSALIGATQNLPRGAYWHNVLGLVDLQTGDPALDTQSAERLWDQLEELAAPYLK